MPEYDDREKLAARIVRLRNLTAPTSSDKWELGQLEKLWNIPPEVAKVLRPIVGGDKVLKLDNP